MEEIYKIKINGEEREVSEGTTYGDIARRYAKEYDSDILLALYNNKVRELFKTVEGNGELSFITITDENGMMAYRRSLVFVMERVSHELLKGVGTVRVLHSMGEGYYCELSKECTAKCNKAFLDKLKSTMQEFVEMDIPIYKRRMELKDARNLFVSMGMLDKDRLMSFRRSSTCNVYELDGYKDYYYGFLVKSTGVLKVFDIIPYDKGFVLLFPSLKEPTKVADFVALDKVFKAQEESGHWADSFGASTIGGLDELIARGEMGHLLQVQEALQEKKISNIAAKINESGNKKIVLIAGPSSSGKTTFANRLCIQLYAEGLRPHLISMDDFFINRADMIPDENGKLDFEALECVDIKEFQKVMNDLLKGKRVSMPTFNFKKGEREYNGNYLEMKENDILVIEGIHGLNPKVSESIDPDRKFKIYISAMSQVNIDEHNCISTTDGRLIRRMVRDARTRGTSARETIARWPSVRAGERKHIFPYQETADVVFNSALVPEIAVLKVYAEPLLYGIPKDCPEYVEARRIIRLLNYVLPFPSDSIVNNSILREFVGGSVFNV